MTDRPTWRVVRTHRTKMGSSHTALVCLARDEAEADAIARKVGNGARAERIVE